MGNLFGGPTESKPEVEKPPVEQAETPKDEPKVAVNSTVSYVARGIDKLKIGKFQFEHGRLEITPEEDAVFAPLLATASNRTRQLVQKVDRDAGEAIARKFIEQRKSRMTTGVDTTANSVQGPNPLDRDNKA